jgi:H+/Cl- antiporter ClcA
MPIDPNTSSRLSAAGAVPSAERRQAVWPWLLLPLVALALFFALRSVKQAPHHAGHTPESAAESASSEAPESP